MTGVKIDNETLEFQYFDPGFTASNAFECLHALVQYQLENSEHKEEYDVVVDKKKQVVRLVRKSGT